MQGNLLQHNHTSAASFHVWFRDALVYCFRSSQHIYDEMHWRQSTQKAGPSTPLRYGRDDNSMDNRTLEV